MNPSTTCRLCGNTAANLADGICANCLSLDETIAPKNSESFDVPTVPPKSTFLDVRTIPPGKSDSSADAPSDQKAFGEYELIEEIARGGMGIVYKAKHRKLNRITALKMILNGRFSSQEELQRFYIEAEAAARLDHPSIVPVYEIGECDGRAFFAMKFIDGGSLAENMSRVRQDPRAAISLLAKVARAVHHAHQRGILHRDLKPANILLDEDDHPLLTDLGLAKNTTGGSDLTHTGAVLGTPSYMAPEQAAGQSVTTSADIYSLGAIMYELLTARPPFNGATTMEIIMQVIDSSPEPLRKVNPSIERDLELICMKCLSRDTEQRYSSAMDLANDLEAWLAGDMISVSPPSVSSIIGRWFRSNQKLAFGSFAILTGFLVCLPIALTFFGDNQDELYSRFSDTQAPLIYSVQGIPEWVSVASAVLLFFVLWPAIGFLAAVIAQPQSARHAFRTGIVTFIFLSVIFTTLAGWMVIAQSSINSSRNEIKVLSNAVWQPEGTTKDEALKTVNAIYDGLENIAVEDRAKLVAERIASDQLASSPLGILIIICICLGFGIPVIYGTVLAYFLLKRGNWLWICGLRYVIAWGAISMGVVLVIAWAMQLLLTTKGAPNSVHTILIVAAVFFGIAYLTVRRWRRRPVAVMSPIGSAT